jgi:hypothetical protein
MKKIKLFLAFITGMLEHSAHFSSHYTAFSENRAYNKGRELVRRVWAP